MLAALARAVRSRRVSAVELVQACLVRIDAAADLNAVIAVRPEAALEDARRLDAAIARGERGGRLAGLPFLSKDNEDAAGLPTTFGSNLYAGGAPATRDGVVAGRLRAEGAILVGKTNIPEFALEGYTANVRYGVTRNPWAKAWSPGGSSGGSAAALAAGLVAIATATDVGGSIRIPAALCGLVGHKPTSGLVGRNPETPSLELNNHGPLATTVADARLLLGIIAGPTSGDPSALPPWRPRRLGRARPGRVLAVGRLASDDPLPGPVERAFADALRILERVLGIPVEPVRANRIFPSGYEVEDWFRVVATEQAHALGREVIETEGARIDPVVRRYLEAGLRMSRDEYLGAHRRRFRYTREFDAALGDDAIVACPTLTVEGWSAEGVLPGAGGPGLPSPVFNTEPPNFTGHPSISLPAGRLPSGLPFGLQLTGPRFGDDLLLDLAAAWEQAAPWPLVADGYSLFGP